MIHWNVKCGTTLEVDLYSFGLCPPTTQGTEIRIVFIIWIAKTTARLMFALSPWLHAFKNFLQFILLSAPFKVWWSQMIPGLTLWEAHLYLVLNLDLNCISGELYTAVLLYCFTNNTSQYAPLKQLHIMRTKRQNVIMVTVYKPFFSKCTCSLPVWYKGYPIGEANPEDKK